MCKLIADLTQTDRRELADRIHRLEAASGQPGVDIRLSAEIYGSLHQKTRALGLDPRDTTPKELYGAALSLAKLHDEFLLKKLNLSTTETSTVILQRSAQVLNRLKIPRSAWTLKAAAVRRLLSKNPPKNLMKQLHYRSADSMLKRENVSALLCLAKQTESPAWQTKLSHLYQRLESSDFEAKPVEVLYPDAKRWGKLAKVQVTNHHSFVVSSWETGMVVVLPLEIPNRPGLMLLSLVHGLKEICEIRIHSSFLKFHQVQPHFGSMIDDVLTQKTNNFHLAGQAINWHMVARHYGQSSRLNHPEIFEPHVQPGDLAYRKAEAVLFRIEPALHFWHQLDYVALPAPDGPVSLNLLDTAINLVNQLPYERRVAYHMQASLWHELHSRYLAQPALERQLLNQLEERVFDQPFVLSELEFAL